MLTLEGIFMGRVQGEAQIHIAQREGEEGKKSGRCKVGGIGRRGGGRKGGWGGRGRDQERLKCSEIMAVSFVILAQII